MRHPRGGVPFVVVNTRDGTLPYLLLRVDALFCNHCCAALSSSAGSFLLLALLFPPSAYSLSFCSALLLLLSFFFFLFFLPVSTATCFRVSKRASCLSSFTMAPLESSPIASGTPLASRRDNHDTCFPSSVCGWTFRPACPSPRDRTHSVDGRCNAPTGATYFSGGFKISPSKSVLAAQHSPHALRLCWI